ncbi:hypothetical protein LUZ60_002031 [Juncus effusus]|nr:hypothetical protein LUZ60_002031 [Juncus effusus]
MLRMNRELFFNLCQKFRERKLLEDSDYVTVEEQVAIFLHVVGHSVRSRVIGINFLRSTETVSRRFKNVLYAIGELRDEYMKPPGIEPSDVITSNPRFSPFFNNCIGAVDGTHTPISVSSKEASRYRGRKHVPTQNILAAVDFNLHFTYVLAGWEGTAHDALVLNNAIEREDGICVPDGKYYLVDAGYSTQPGFISPFRGVRYHLKEFSSNPPTTDKELFNLRHSSLRTTVERAFGALKNRFKILTTKPFFPESMQVDIAIACCIIHNYIIDVDPDTFVPTEEEVASSSTFQSSRSRGARRDDAREWVQKREQIMRDMWDARGM